MSKSQERRLKVMKESDMPIPLKKKKPAAVSLGKLGGAAVAKKHGNGYMKRIGKRGAKARWSKEK